ncbi:cysteine dioxygenase [Lacinutrix undariae]
MKPLYTLQEFIAALSESSKDNYNNVFEKFKIDKAFVSQFESWSDEKYVRNCIYKCDDFELILLCWEPKQGTSIHCHGGEDCWMYVVEGELEEIQFQKSENDILIQKGTRKMEIGDCVHINDSIAVHQLRNSCSGRSMSLHLYAKPILKCSYYSKVTKRFELKTLKYDTFKTDVLNK